MTAAALRTQVGPLALDNPLMSASGTFGSGWEARGFGDLRRVGALVSKTVTVLPRPGNPPPRLFETPSGMLNSIGLENKGADHFLAETLPRMRGLGPKVIVNIGGESVGEFVELAQRFAEAGVDALEVNLSCPNVQGGRLLFSSEPEMAEQTIRQVKAVARVPVLAKLSPNVTRIADIAQAVERGGADAITAINTLIGMAVDWRRRRPVLGRTIGGLSGPAIKPVALRMVYEIRRAVRIPVVAAGGIAGADDVLEFLVTGACAAQIGTWNFVDPTALTRALDELEAKLAEAGTTVMELIGSLQAEPPRDDATLAPAERPRPTEARA